MTGEAIIIDGSLSASGPALATRLAVDPAKIVGVNRGTTGQGSTVRSRL